MSSYRQPASLRPEYLPHKRERAPGAGLSPADCVLPAGPSTALLYYPAGGYYQRPHFTYKETETRHKKFSPKV